MLLYSRLSGNNVGLFSCTLQIGGLERAPFPHNLNSKTKRKAINQKIVLKPEHNRAKENQACLPLRGDRTAE